jgi:hypothetical protein
MREGFVTTMRVWLCDKSQIRAIDVRDARRCTLVDRKEPLMAADER